MSGKLAIQVLNQRPSVARRRTAGLLASSAIAGLFGTALLIIAAMATAQADELLDLNRFQVAYAISGDGTTVVGVGAGGAVLLGRVRRPMVARE